MMIFYFTGTGNSLYVAKELEGDVRSIPQVLHQKDLSFTAEKIGIVCPIYGHEMPRMVKEFIEKAEFRTPYFYMVLTYGANHGGAAQIADAFVQKAGKKADYVTTVEMVDNFLPVFDMEKQMAMDKQVEKQLERVKADIAACKKEIQKATMKDKMVHKAFRASMARMKKAPEAIWADYVVTDECVGCGICTRVCPAGCIHLEEQKAIHSEKSCQSCYACIQACPKKAILFKEGLAKEPNPNACYRNEHVTLTELVEANDQTGLC